MKILRIDTYTHTLYNLFENHIYSLLIPRIFKSSKSVDSNKFVCKTQKLWLHAFRNRFMLSF